MNYWHVLEQARHALAAGRFREAEDLLTAAAAERARSPRRMFLTETGLDLARRLSHTLRRQELPAGSGRWQRATESLRRDFLACAGTTVTEALRRADLRPEDDPEANQPILASALYLVVASRLHPGAPATAVPILKALLRTSRHTGRAFDRELLRADLPLTPEDRLWLARTGDEVLTAAAAAPVADGFAAADWTRTLLALLTPDHFRAAPALEVERRWWAAHLSDRHLGEPEAALHQYLDLLALPQLPPERAAAARLRCVELLANLTGTHFPVPRYREAWTLLADQDDDATRPHRATLAHRRPPDRPDQAWACAHTTTGGRIEIVLWWGETPRDCASWREGEDVGPLVEFLEPAAGRIVWDDARGAAALAGALGGGTVGRPLAPLVSALLEPWLPADGLDREAAWRLGLARSGPWRDDWRADRSHPDLVPPGADGNLTRAQARIEAALAAGLLWLACLRRIDEADPALRAGLAELGRRGDPVAAFIYECAGLGSPAKRALDAAFAPWTLPLLWTRPSPLGGVAADASRQGGDDTPRPDLAGNDLVVISTGAPGRDLAVWGGRDRRWRVVLDQLSRLAQLGEVARDAYGPATVVPAGGLVHDLHAALAWLEELAATPGEGEAALLGVLHWLRLVESHNGDLLDFLRLRPRPRGRFPLLDLYADGVQRLDREQPRPQEDPAAAGWGAQYAQRVRKSGLVVGTVAELVADAATLDTQWGVYDGSEASWVFLDSAAVHWQLWRRDPALPARLHALLVTRGRRHASVLIGGSVLPLDLAACLDELLASYGRPYHLDLGGVRPPHLRLVGRGPAPGSRLLAVDSWLAPLHHLETVPAPAVVLLPADPLAAEFWTWAARGGNGRWRLAASTTELSATGAPVARLVVPRLVSLDTTETTGGEPAVDTLEAWREADVRRQQQLRRARRIAGLEFAALLATPVTAVEVLDGRWWRRLLAGDWNSARATGELGAPAEIFDLAAGGAAARMRETVSDWLGQHGSALDDPDAAGMPAVVPAAGVHLSREDSGIVWRQLAAWVLRSWEAGEPIGRLVLLGDTPPAGAAALIAALGCPGATVPSPEGSGSPEPAAGPVFWLRPRDVARVERHRAGALQPDAVLVPDLGSWLPTAGTSRDDTAGALRWLGDCGAARVMLAGAGLSPAWQAFLAARLRVRLPADASRLGGWRELRRGEILRADIECRCCGQVAPPAGEVVCERCGYDLAAEAAVWPHRLSGAARRESVRLLARQRDLGRDRPLDIWSEDPLTAGDLAAAALPATQDAGETDSWSLADGRRWRMHSALRGRQASPGTDNVLLGVPASPAVLAPLAPPGPSSLVLLYDAAAVGEAPPPGDRAATRRLLRLLSEGGDLLARGEREIWAAGLRGEAVVPVMRLARESGLDPAAVVECLAVLRWTARLAGIGREAVVSEASGGRLFVAGPLAAIEHELLRLKRDLRPVLTQWLGASVAGAWLEVESPAFEPADASLRRQRLDACLHLAAHAPLDGERPRFGYRLENGAWCGHRRWVLSLTETSVAVDWLENQLDRLLEAARELMSVAVPVDAGYIVAPEPSDPRPPWSVPTLIWGQELGLWHAVGLRDPWQVPLAELDRLAEDAVSGPLAPGARLVVDLAAERTAWRAALAATRAHHPLLEVKSGEPAADPAAPASGRRLWPRRNAEIDPVAAAARSVAEAAAAAPDGTLVLTGTAGTGRLEALLDGLQRSLAGPRAPDEIIAWCPDAATAARLHLATLARGAGWRLDLRVVDGTGEHPVLLDERPSGSRRLTVLPEMQRLPREWRYQLQDTVRAGAVVLTIDPAETGESWEALLLTVPGQDRICPLDVQRLQARRLWEEIAPLLGRRDAHTREHRRDPGQVISRAAGNLDECVNAVVAEVEAGRLGRSLDLVAPLPDDAAFLGRALAGRGFVAAQRQEVEGLLLPGGLELLAVTDDLVTTAAGEAGRRETDGRPSLVLPACLPSHLAESYRHWLRTWAAAPPATLREVWQIWRRTPWGRTCAGNVAANARGAALVAGSGDESPASLFERPLLVAWRDRLGEALGRDDLRSGRPVVRIATADQPAGAPAESLVYVCFGSEPDQVHYRVMSRATDRLLVLWQERSPLASEAEEAPRA